MKNAMQWAFAVLLCMGTLAGASEYTITDGFTVTGFEFGKLTSNVKVTKLPSACFDAKISITRNGKEFEGTIDNPDYNYGINFKVNISDKGACVDDSLVNILKYTKLNEEHLNFVVNG